MKNKEARSIFSSLEHFTSPPPPELWEKIEAELDQPKKKRRPVIWWWVAAGLIAGLSIPTMWYVSSNQGIPQELNIENNTNEVVLQKDSKFNVNASGNVNDNKNNVVESSSSDQKNNNVIAVAEEKLNAKNNSNSLTTTNAVAIKTVSPTLSKSKDSGKYKNSNEEKERQFVAKKSYEPQSLTKNNAVAIKTFPAIPTEMKESGKNINSSHKKQSQFIAESNDKRKSNGTLANKNATAGNFISTSVVVKNNAVQGNNSSDINKAIAEKSSVSKATRSKENTASTNFQSTSKNQNTEISEFNSNKAIAKNNTSKDSLTTIQKEVKQLENALVEADKDKNKKKNDSEVIDRWSLQVFAGVASSENYTNEKALGNTVASQQSMGYGVKTNYKLNKKWAVSSGFKVNELGQNIEGVAYYERQSSEALKGGLLPFVSDVASNSISKNSSIVFVSKNDNYLFASNANATGFEKGDVTQNLKYFEMPVEVSYSLLNKKKTSISMNTGGFVGKLISNELLLNGNSIGENNNVNEFIYGTLLSSTLQYEFYKKTKFFIEPGMNYYVNPLENQSFNQFQWVFNFGINVNF